jgi:hypothetical protein
MKECKRCGTPFTGRANQIFCCNKCAVIHSVEAARFRDRGITREIYAEMLAKQNGVCGICKQPEVVVGRRLAVDHSYTTGKNRGLLCFTCNVRLGWYENNREAVAEYLAPHE